MAAGYGGAALPLWEAFWLRCRRSAAVADVVPAADIAAHLAQLAALYHRSSPTLEAVCATVAPLDRAGDRAGTPGFAAEGPGLGPGFHCPLSEDPAAVRALERLHPLRLLANGPDRGPTVEQLAAACRGGAHTGHPGRPPEGSEAGAPLLVQLPPVDRAGMEALLSQQARMPTRILGIVCHTSLYSTSCVLAWEAPTFLS